MRKLQALTLPQTAVGALALLLALPASAADPADPDDVPSSWGLGLGAVSTQKPYAGADRETRALPMISYENRWLQVIGLGVEAKLPRLRLGDMQHLDFRLLARYDGSGFDADDAPILAGMADRKSGILAGGKVTWHTGVANLAAEWTADASGHSKGQRFGLSLTKNFRLGQQVMLTPRLGATWLDKKYVHYYFGVLANEAVSGRPAYLGSATVNTELSLRGTYLLDRHHSVFVDVGVTRLGRAIQDSPLVDRSTENRVFMGYLYRF